MAYLDMVGAFEYKKPLFRTKADQLGDNDKWLKDNNWQDGVKVLFIRPAVPTGWTQDVSVNDKFMRVCDNAGGNIGGITGGNLSVAGGLSMAHAHTLTADPNHTHDVTTHASQHTFPDGQGLNTSGVSASPPLFGLGNVFCKFNANSAGATGVGNWSRTHNGLNELVSEADASSSAGTHTNTISSDLGTINPKYMDAIIGTKDSDTGYTDLTASINHNDRIKFDFYGLTAGLYGNDVYNEKRVTPFGAYFFFYQTTPPAGIFTKFISNPDHALRIVSGTGAGIGGTLGTAQFFPMQHGHTNATSSTGSHNHTTGAHRHDVRGADSGDGNYRSFIAHGIMDQTSLSSGEYRATGFGGGTETAVKGRSTKTASGLTMGTEPNHTHNIGNSLSDTLIKFAFCHVTYGQKVLGTPPYAYEDLTNNILDEKLISRQKLDKYGKNDEFLKYNTIPSGTKMFFYQSAIPLTWTLDASENDRCLRISDTVGGTTTGSGTQFLSANFAINHTHPIGNNDHTHTVPSHSHVLENGSTSTGGILTGTSSSYSRYASNYADNVGSGNEGGGSPTLYALTTNANATAGATDNYGHDHGGTSSASLTDTNFAYANVILCTKN